MLRSSKFFRAAFNENWKEGIEGSIVLPEDEANIVHHYLHFLHTGTFASIPADLGDEDDVEGHHEEYILLVKLYLFGEKYQDIRLKNAVIIAIIKKAETRDSGDVMWYPTGPEVDVLYRGSPFGSPLKRLILDMYALDGEESWLDEEINQEWLIELGKLFLKMSRQPRKDEVEWIHTWHNPANYHESKQ